MNGPTKTLAWLVALSVTTTLLARYGPGGAVWVSLAFLLLSAMKARFILGGYLGLNASRFWLRGFSVFTGVFLMLAAGLYLLPLAS